MTTVRTFSDEDLCLYLDREADEDMVSHIEQALESDGALQIRVAELKDAEKYLIQSFETSLGLAPEMPKLPKSSISKQTVWQVCGGSMVAGALVAIGLICRRLDLFS